MKQKLKIVQMVGLFLMAIVVIRAELLHIIQVNDIHFIEVYTTIFIISIVMLLLYPIYLLIKKHTLNPLNWIRSVIQLIEFYVNK